MENLTGNFDRNLMTVVDLTDDQKKTSAKRAAPSGTPDCEASARAKQRAKTVSANRAASQPTGSNRKARVSQQEGVSQPTGRRESANHPGNQNHPVFGLAKFSKFTSQNLRLAALFFGW